MIRATVKATDLAGALRDGVAQSSGPLPILQHALVETRPSGLRITTTDLETLVQTIVPAEIKATGETCVHVGLMKAATAAGTDLVLEADAGTVVVKRGPRSRVRVPALPAHDWPVPDQFEWRPAPIAWQDLATAIDACEYAASRKDIRPYCNAVCLSQGFIGCADGKRIAFVVSDYAGDDMLVPIRAVNLLRKYLGSGCELQVGFANGEASRIGVSSGDDRCEIKLFPKQKIPPLPAFLPAEAPDASALLDRTALRAAVARLLPFAATRDAAKGVALPIARIAHVDGVIRLEDRSGENADEAGVIEATASIGGAIDLSLLAGVLDVIGTDQVRFDQFGAAGSAGVRYVVTADGHPAKHVIAGATA